MVKVRGKGEVYFDSVDLEILEFLIDRAQNGAGVLEIADKLNISHKSLKPHIDKLRFLDLIVIVETTAVFGKTNNNVGEIKLCVPTAWYDDPSDWREGYEEEIKKQLRRFEEVIKSLRKIKNYEEEKEISKKLEMDLRKKPILENKKKIKKK